LLYACAADQGGSVEPKLVDFAISAVLSAVVVIAIASVCAEVCAVEIASAAIPAAES
jgi:hypothetical protein